MGVVTDGAEGQEMHTTFQRLAKARGVQVRRADTGTARDHSFNADQIKKEVMEIEGDWCYIGYSQGCANALLVETELSGGTPEEREAVQRLRTRNLLFSAANGSPHGTCGEEKGWKVAMRTENFGKHLQATNSETMVTLFMNMLKNVLNLQEFVHAYTFYILSFTIANRRITIFEMLALVHKLFEFSYEIIFFPLYKFCFQTPRSFYDLLM